MITLDYINTTILSNELIFVKSEEIYNVYSEWATSLNINKSINEIYEMCCKGIIKNDKSIFFFNFINSFKYFELYGLFNVGK